MPRMFLACSSASSRVLATLTPPPLPRPPAWICALTTTPGAPSANSLRATAAASSNVVAISPLGTATPYRARISFAWYSWIFKGREPRANPRLSCGFAAQSHHSGQITYPKCVNRQALSGDLELLIQHAERAAAHAVAPGRGAYFCALIRLAIEQK